MPALSEWLQLMLAEIAGKREALERARAEEARRALENAREDRDAAQARGDQSIPPARELPEHGDEDCTEESSAARAARR